MADGPPFPLSDEDDISPGAQDQQRQQQQSFKRLVVCCDGTWLDADSGLQNGDIVPPSNVTRITRAVRTESSDGIQQIVYYQAGIGSMGTIGNKVVGGISGYGLAEHVREAYSFIANNWEDGDEIFLVGFSRGAFTARSVGGLIGNIGVMTKAGLMSFPIVFKDFTHRYKRDYRSPLPDVPFPNKPRFSDPAYALEMQRRHLTTLNVRIKAIGVFDTVGALGVPRISWLGNLGQKASTELGDFAFYDTRLDECIDNAFQALALDEKRASFGPCVWEKRGNERTKLVQMWFPGVHSNVGGGYPDQEIANITLAWMMSMLEPLLDLDLEYIMTQDKLNVQYYRSKGSRVRSWSFGKIYNSDTGKYLFGGSINRTPGDYFRVNPRTGEVTTKPLYNTNEYIHASVRARLALDGPGYDDRGIYRPRALRDWKLRYEKVEGLPSPWFWELQGPEPVILPESNLRPVELMLLRESPRIEDYVLNPPSQRRKQRRP